MVIELNIARRVVSELHDAIRQPINLMDENGRIIASTDASRIGTVHSAACQAIRENMECLVVRADGEYAGSRIGVNVPLRFDGKIVGVVGDEPTRMTLVSSSMAFFARATESRQY